MISIALNSGEVVRLLSPAQGLFGFHPTFGFISESSLRERTRARRQKGLPIRDDWKCRFSWDGNGFSAISDCQVESLSTRGWVLVTAFGEFLLSELHGNAPTAGLEGRAPAENQRGARRSFEKALGLTVLLLALLVLVLPKGPQEIAPLVISEPVEVKLANEAQKQVQVADVAASLPKELLKQIKDKKTQVAVAQNLGFLSMLGRKNLSKALGGLLTLSDSKGAGAGGKQGSGGELLVGLGQGVTRTTVGNSGVVGLGGVGTHGVGGGAGGYGTGLVASGNGEGLSSVALSQDIVLEGGLDRSVIQATIAKYLNQIRACYEEGLRQTPGLQGQVSVLFEIIGSGAVDSARVSRSSLGNAGVESCITHKILTWQFPQPRGGVKVKVNYPFMLRPVKS